MLKKRWLEDLETKYFKNITQIMMAVNGQADFMSYLAAYTCKWDSCAG